MEEVAQRSCGSPLPCKCSSWGWVRLLETWSSGRCASAHSATIILWFLSHKNCHWLLRGMGKTPVNEFKYHYLAPCFTPKWADDFSGFGYKPRFSEYRSLTGGNVLSFLEIQAVLSRAECSEENSQVFNKESRYMVRMCCFCLLCSNLLSFASYLFFL